MVAALLSLKAPQHEGEGGKREGKRYRERGEERRVKGGAKGRWFKTVYLMSR